MCVQLSSLLGAGATNTAVCPPLWLYFLGTKLLRKELVRNKATERPAKTLHKKQGRGQRGLSGTSACLASGRF